MKKAYPLASGYAFLWNPCVFRRKAEKTYPVAWGMLSSWNPCVCRFLGYVFFIWFVERAPLLGLHYLSNTTCLRPHLCSTALLVKYGYLNLLHDSKLLKKTRLRQAVLDKWPDCCCFKRRRSGESVALHVMFIVILARLYTCISLSLYIYIYIYIYISCVMYI